MLSLFVLLLSCSYLLAESKVVESKRSYNYVFLTCQTNTGSDRNPQWRFNGTQLAETRCYNHITSRRDGSISVTVTPNCEGIVSCSAQAPEVTDNYALLAYPVVIYDSVVVVKAKEGSSVTLDCRLEISALNNIEVIWKKNPSVSLQPVSSDNYSLVLTNVNSSHTGIYICEGTARRLSCDDILCKKKTFTYLEVGKFNPVIVFKSAKIPEASNNNYLIGYLVAVKVCGVVSGVSISLGIMGVVSGVSISLGIVGVVCLIVSYKRKLRNSQDAKLEIQVICKREEDCNSSCSVGSHSNGTHFTITSNNEVILNTSGSISEYSV